MNELESLLGELLKEDSNYDKLLKNPTSTTYENDMKQIGNINNLPEELNNPFNPDYVTDISIRTFKRRWDPTWCTYGTITFKKRKHYWRTRI